MGHVQFASCRNWRPLDENRTLGPLRDNAGMNFQKFLVAVLGIALLALAYRAYGWPGIAIAAGGIVMWVLLNFTRTVTILQRAANAPVGHVASAVMLNAKLKPRATLQHTIAMTRALGERRSVADAQPEIYRWTDAGGSHVTCEFTNGRLVRWQLVRPSQESEVPVVVDQGADVSQSPSRIGAPAGTHSA